MKKQFIKPEIEVILLEKADVLTTSEPNADGGHQSGGGDDGEANMDGNW